MLTLGEEMEKTRRILTPPQMNLMLHRDVPSDRPTGMTNNKPLRDD